MSLFKKDLIRVSVPAEVWDALAGLGKMTDDGLIDLSGIGLARIEEREERDDPIAAHRRRVLSG